MAPSQCARAEFRLRVVHPSTRRRVNRALLAGDVLERQLQPEHSELKHLSHPAKKSEEKKRKNISTVPRSLSCSSRLPHLAESLQPTQIELARWSGLQGVAAQRALLELPPAEQLSRHLYH